jgi:ribonuclease HI
MAIKGLAHEDNKLIDIRVSSDSQGALRGVQSAKTNDSLALVKKMKGAMAKATSSLHSVPGHEGTKGNEKVNELAQKAMEADSSMPNLANDVPIQAIYARAKVMNSKPEPQKFYGTTKSKYL